MRATATKPFIVQADARLFKGKNKLSRGGQSVYMVMRSLADGSTGELAINGHALSSRTICEQGGFSRWTWLKYRKELLAAGLLYEQRERVSVYDHKAERMRTVLAETHYFVPRQAEVPKTAKKPTILLESGSRTVEEPDPQSIQIPRNLPPVAVGVVPLVVPEGTGRESSSPPPKPEPMIRQPRPLQEKAQTKGQTGRNAAIAEWMKANDLDGPTWTAAVVTHIEARRETKKPHNAFAYWKTCLANLTPQDNEQIREQANIRFDLRRAAELRGDSSVCDHGDVRSECELCAERLQNQASVASTPRESPKGLDLETAP